MHGDNAGLSATELLDLNRDLQGSRAIRLLATTNLSLYATLMERHLSDGALPETELVVQLDRDLEDVNDPQPGLALIKSWAAQGWLHRIVDERHGQNVCYLTQDARRALDFLRGLRRQDTIATGGSITGIAARLKQVAVKVDNDPARIRKHIEAEIAALHEELDQLDAGQRPQTDVTDCYDEARAIALQMERLITDIGQYGTMIERATSALDEPIDSNAEYRDRQRQMYSDYQAAWDSQGRDSHRSFLRMINDPDQRAEFEADVAAVAEALPRLDPALCKVMAGFFELVGHQIDEVERIQQRCAQRVKRFTAFGTMEQSRGVARQLNEAIAAAAPCSSRRSPTHAWTSRSRWRGTRSVPSVPSASGSATCPTPSPPNPATPRSTSPASPPSPPRSTRPRCPTCSTTRSPRGLSRYPTPSPCSTPPTWATSSCCGPGPSNSPTPTPPSRPPSASAPWTAVTSKSRYLV